MDPQVPKQERDHQEAAHRRGDDPGDERPAHPGRIPSPARSSPLYRTAPAITGSESRNENRAAVSRSNVSTRAAVIVTRTRDARLERERLGDAEHEPVADAEVLQVPPRRRDPVHRVEHHAEHHEHHGDQPRLPELVLDEALERGPDDVARDRPDDERPGEAFVGRADPAGGDRVERRPRVARHVVPEVDERADERPEVQGDVERLVQVRIGQDRPVEQPRHDDQVARARDRRELGHALGDAEHDRLQDAQGVVSSGDGTRTRPILAARGAF